MLEVEKASMFGRFEKVHDREKNVGNQKLESLLVNDERKLATSKSSV